MEQSVAFHAWNFNGGCLAAAALSIFMNAEDPDTSATFGKLAGTIMIALKDRDLPSLEERWVQTDVIHGFNLQVGDIEQPTFWIRQSELQAFGFETPEAFDEALVGSEGYEPWTEKLRLTGDRFFRAYRRKV